MTVHPAQEFPLLAFPPTPWHNKRPHCRFGWSGLISKRLFVRSKAPTASTGANIWAQELAANGQVSRVRGLFLLDMIGDKDLNVARETGSDPILQDVMSSSS